MNPLLATLRDPTLCSRLSVSDWDRLVRMARRTKLMGHLFYHFAEADLGTAYPAAARDMFTAGSRYATYLQTRANYLIRTVTRSLEPDDFPLVLLKGAAYAAAKLPNARGRLLADVDILVRREHLDRIEQRLLSLGWEPQKLDGYDQRYYREWMHEIPPLKHPELGVELDVHHTLLPITARVTPDPSVLWEASVPLGEGPLRVLAPTDMVLHSAAHLFYDGQIAGALRDLVDLHELFRHYGRDPDFWRLLPERAQLLQLGRPLYYALRYCRRLLGTEIPPDVSAKVARAAAPPAPVRVVMDALVERALTPRPPTERDALVSEWLLYARSHWLRMPPWLLAKHLSRKTFRRLVSKSA